MSTTPPRIINATIRGVPNQWAIHDPDSNYDNVPWRSLYDIDTAGGSQAWHADHNIDWSTVEVYTLIPGALPEVERRGTSYWSGGWLLDSYEDDEYVLAHIRALTAMMLRRQADRAKPPSLREDLTLVLGPHPKSPAALTHAHARLRAALDAGHFDHLGEQQ